MTSIPDTRYYFWKRGEDIPLGPHFASHEFTCSCGTCVDQTISQDLIERLTEMRDDLGEKIHINSGYRCPDKQAELKASGYETSPGVSQHTLGNAADISTFPDLMHQLLVYSKQHFTAIGVAHSFIHVDTRPPPPRIWSYSTL